MFGLASLSTSSALITAGCGTVPAPGIEPWPRDPDITPRVPVRPEGARRALPFDSLDELFAADPDARRNDVIMVSLSQLGTPYVWGGTRPDTGFDCSGLVTYVFQQALGMRTPRSAFDQARWARPVGARELLRPADLLFYNTLGRPYSHVGIFIGNDRFIHAPASGHAVRVEPMSLDYWRGRFNGARRVLV